MSQVLMQLRDSCSHIDAFDTDEVTELIDSLDISMLEAIQSKEFAPIYDNCLGRILQIRDALNDRFADRESIVKLLLACTISQTPLVLLGEPGTAKSELVRALCLLLGLREDHLKIHEYEEKMKRELDGNTQDSIRVTSRPLFEYLVTRFTTPDEILGPVNIDAMLKLSIHYRESVGMLPNAQIAFLDEIFKANSSILNALLSIINEGIYYNAGQAFDVDLFMVFGASNESPDDNEELAALYDRFPIRALCESVSRNKTLDLFQKSENMAYAKEVYTDEEEATVGQKVACINDLRLLARMNYICYGDKGRLFADGKKTQDDEFAEHFRSLFCSLRDEFGISDRTPVKLARISKAMAMLEKRNHLQADDLEVFKYCAPNTDAARIMNNIVSEYIKAVRD